MTDFSTLYMSSTPFCFKISCDFKSCELKKKYLYIIHYSCCHLSNFWTCQWMITDLGNKTWNPIKKEVRRILQSPSHSLLPEYTVDISIILCWIKVRIIYTNVYFCAHFLLKFLDLFLYASTHQSTPWQLLRMTNGFQQNLTQKQMSQRY